MLKRFRVWITTGWWGSFTSGTAGGIAGTVLTGILVILWNKISPGTFNKVFSAFWKALKATATYQVSIWSVFAFLTVWYLANFLVRNYKSLKKVDADEVWKKVIGNYSFKDLSDVLRGEFLSASKIPGSSVDNGIVNFYKYAHKFIEGLGPTTLADKGFAYTELAPYFGLHQLVDKRADAHYYLNDNGHLLYASLATTFKNYPDYKTEVYATQVRYVPPLPDVVYTGEQANNFNIGFTGTIITTTIRLDTNK